MGKIMVFNNLSLDGFFADAKGGVHWALGADPELTRYVQRHRKPVSCYLFGRKTFEMFAAFWPSPAGRAASPYYAKLLTETPKLVFSRRLKRPTWANTTVRARPDAKTLRSLRARKGDCLIFGSGSLVRDLLRRGELDELQIVLNPVILGKGKPLFSPLPGPLGMKLLETRPFKNGTVLLRFGKGKGAGQR